MMKMLRTLAGAALALSVAAGGAQAQQVLFWSTQARPVEEPEDARRGAERFDGAVVDYQVAEAGPWLTRLQAELQAAPARSACLAACMATSPVSAPTLSICPRSMSAGSRSTSLQEARQLAPVSRKYIAVDAGDLSDGGQTSRRCNILPSAPTSTRSL